MKALVFYDAQKCRFEERGEPQITSSDQVIVHVRAVGICGSDMATYLGAPTRKLPLVPCHEFAGEVYEVGSGVTQFSVGDRVVVEPMLTCGNCYACKTGRKNVCRSLKTVGSHCDGAMQEFFLTTENHLYRIPDSMTFIQATLIEPYTIGAQINTRLNTKAGDRILVHGAGPIGLIIMLVANKIGAKVAVSQRSEGRRMLAKKLGAAMVINPQTENIDEKIKEFTEGRGPNIIIDSAGIPELTTKAVFQAGENARLGNICFAQKDIKLDLHEFVSKKLSLHGSRLQINQFQNVIDNYTDIIVKNDSIITNVFPFENADQAFSLFGNREDNTCKIVVDNS